MIKICPARFDVFLRNIDGKPKLDVHNLTNKGKISMWMDTWWGPN